MHHDWQIEIRRTLSLFVLVLASTCWPLPTKEAFSGQVPHLRAGFHSSDWQLRAGTFYDLIPELSRAPAHSIQDAVREMLVQHAAEAAAVKLSLIDLLHMENAYINDIKNRHAHFSEEYSNYYGNVIGVVAALQDPRSIPELADAIATGDMATRTLAGFGEVALPSVISKLNDPDPINRSAALFALQEMLQMGTVIDSQSRMKIESAFLNALKDREGSVRGAGVSGLAVVGDKTVIPLLTRIARHDPEVLKGQADGGGDLYPVRHDATLALDKLRGK